MKNKQEEWNIVDLLSHSRHDWMNKLQLIKGNLSLQKYDRVDAIIEELIIEAKQESKLCNLKVPTFASSLLTFNWDPHHFQLEYEIVGEIVLLEAFDEAISSWSSSFFSLLDKLVDKCHDNHLTITINIDSDIDRIRFFFDFNGIIKETDPLINWLHTNHVPQVNVKEFQVNTYEAAIVVSLGN
ncbi:Spo0B C-terminal domain-containing protein [Metabacillus malikii]|uniref:Stage 0 sporulation protein B (Sporulation initiation phosphotransferase) n=1 Tax=Metabacillus malikii TaxID=1504265 RepID=A0ABT9ZKP5_9BACI|nr:Spo0B C-terminal domain-containing protein [Metabacillus malikii]MDQ0232838.1 stage 0 sporulation protein B (sporulation initiation phosphotransferase) [Metabacillus malikii]